MGKKNKRKKSVRKNIAVPYPGPLLSVLIVAALVSLTYLWMCSRCEALGNEIASLEAHRAALDNRLRTEKSLWAERESLEGIRQGLRRFGIEMTLPSMDRIVIVPRHDIIAGVVPFETEYSHDYFVQSGYE